MSSKKGFNISFEYLDELPAVAEQLNCSATLAEMSEAEAQTTSMNDDIEDGIRDTDTLDKIADIMQVNIEGGVSSQTAEMVNLVTESIYDRYGIRSRSVGHEAFTEPSKAIFTEVAYESIKESLAKLWKLIVSAMNTAYESVVNFIKKIFGSAKAVQQKAEKAAEDVKQISFDKTPTQTEFEVQDGVASEDMRETSKKKLSASAITLIFGDKTDTPSVVRSAEALAKQLNAMPTIYEQVAKSIKITQLLMQEFGDKKSVDNISFPTFTHGLQKSGDQDGKYSSEMLLGGMALIVTGAAESTSFKGLESIHAMSSTSFHIGPWNSKQQREPHRTIPVLNEDSINKILAESISISISVQKLENQADQMQTSFKQLVSQANSFNAFSDDPTKEMKQAFSDLKGVIGSVKTICSTGLPSVLSYSLRSSNALVDYCYASMACYGKVKVSTV